MHYRIFDSCGIKEYKPAGANPLLIRILEPRYKVNSNISKIRHINRYLRILEVYFEDVDTSPPEGYENRFVLFNKSIAKEICDAVLSDDYDELVIHCGAGQSRSPAVMIGIGYLFKDDTVEQNIRRNKYYNPNQLVIDIFKEYVDSIREVK